MGFECRFFLETPAAEEMLVERSARDRRGRHGQRVQKRVPEW